eukprot:TRINITY_DN47321_c0_g1_i2.p1 TRINITY_DN47321_c0_g1~~TRINITY_DN47321_c0_g1_i2.p1  ORF type:complete len:642 (-),score=76.11 TRINITY_DN47321_c0_g1_i2:139-2064(-)
MAALVAKALSMRPLASFRGHEDSCRDAADASGLKQESPTAGLQAHSHSKNQSPSSRGRLGPTTASSALRVSGGESSSESPTRNRLGHTLSAASRTSDESNNQSPVRNRLGHTASAASRDSGGKLSLSPTRSHRKDGASLVERVTSEASPVGGTIFKTLSMNPTRERRRSSQLQRGVSQLLEKQELHSVRDPYECIVRDARKHASYKSRHGEFPQEWDAQLLVDCGHGSSGKRIVLFTPAFLLPWAASENSDHDLDLAMKFLLYTMDKIAMHESYIFVYCHAAMNWASPGLAHRLRMTYDILPKKFRKKVHSFIVLHPTAAFKVSLAGAWVWLSKRFWHKIQYQTSLDALCELLEPESAAARADLRRRFPLIVQREDAVWTGCVPPAVYGVHLKSLCSSSSADYIDKTTGRLYAKLPPSIILLVEALERHGGDEAFFRLFDTDDAGPVYEVVAALDQGFPLDTDVPASAMWCALKLFIDCLPSPLLTFQAFPELQARQLTATDRKALKSFLREILHEKLANETAHVVLYLASFFHMACQTSRQRARAASDELAYSEALSPPETGCLSPRIIAEVFAAGFLRPRQHDADAVRYRPVAIAAMETLIVCAEDPELWSGIIAANAPDNYVNSDGESSNSSSAESVN